MKKVSVIISADYDFQIIQIVDGNSHKAWEIANKMFDDGAFKKCGIEHYDVFEFDNMLELNIWSLEQVALSRSKKSREPIKIS